MKKRNNLKRVVAALTAALMLFALGSTGFAAEVDEITDIPVIESVEIDVPIIAVDVEEIEEVEEVDLGELIVDDVDLLATGDGNVISNKADVGTESDIKITAVTALKTATDYGYKFNIKLEYEMPVQKAVPQITLLGYVFTNDVPGTIEETTIKAVDQIAHNELGDGTTVSKGEVNFSLSTKQAGITEESTLILMVGSNASLANKGAQAVAIDLSLAAVEGGVEPPAPTKWEATGATVNPGSITVGYDATDATIKAKLAEAAVTVTGADSKSSTNVNVAWATTDVITDGTTVTYTGTVTPGTDAEWTGSATVAVTVTIESAPPVTWEATGATVEPSSITVNADANDAIIVAELNKATVKVTGANDESSTDVNVAWATTDIIAPNKTVTYTGTVTPDTDAEWTGKQYVTVSVKINPWEATGATVNPDSLTVGAGATDAIIKDELSDAKITVTGASGRTSDDLVVEWTTDDEIADGKTVTYTGKVTPAATAQWAGTQYVTVEVTIEEPVPTTWEATGATVDPDSITFEAGATEALIVAELNKATVKVTGANDESSTDVNVVWSTDDEIADGTTVTYDGVITPAAGAQWTGKQSVTVSVTIKPWAAVSVKASPAAITVDAGATDESIKEKLDEIEITVSGENNKTSRNVSVEWATEDEIDDNTVVTYTGKVTPGEGAPWTGTLNVTVTVAVKPWVATKATAEPSVIEYSIGTNVVAKLAEDIEITVSNDKKSEGGYKATWTAPEEFDMIKPGEYVFAGTVTGPDSTKKATWSGALEATVKVVVKALENGVIAPVTTVELVATEADTVFDAAAAKAILPETLNIAFGSYKDTIAITDSMITATDIDTSVGGVSDGAITITIPAGTKSVDGKFKVAEETVFTVNVKVVKTISPIITISEVETKPGKEVEITVNLEKNTGFSNLNIEIGYDSSVMTLTDAKSAEGVAGYFTPAETYVVNPYNMSWDYDGGVEFNGDIATLTFTIKDDAPAGVYPITVDYYKGNDGNYVDGEDVNYDVNEDPIAFIYVNGDVTIVSYRKGDINGDEKLNSKDATYLLRYLAGWDNIRWFEQSMDVNGDSTINENDATHLLRYLAGWNVTLAE